MPRTLSDDEFNMLMGKKQVADFAESFMADPAFSPRLKRLVKEKYPQMQIPDLDIEDRINARFDQDRQQREQEAAAAREAREREDWTTKRSATQQRYGFTDDAMKKLEDMMVEKNVGDYDIAASYMAQREPKPSDAAFTADRWQHEKAPGFAEIAKDPEGWGRTEILKAIRADQDKVRGNY